MDPTQASARVLVVEDDATVAEVVGRYLERDGYQVEVLTDGAMALARALSSPPDLILLDLMLPGMDGMEVCRRIRGTAPTPIIMLTARGQEGDRVLGLELGADDYVAKPFSPRELTARVRAVLRRSVAAAGSKPAGREGFLRAGAIELDPTARTVRVAGRDASLTAREFDLLAFLMDQPHRVFRREQLLEDVWGYTFGDTSTVTVHIRRLREKIEPDPAAPTHIKTVWGVGYRFEP